MSVVTSDVRFSNTINQKILEFSEDQLTGFVRDPIGELMERTGFDEETILARLRAMLSSGTIRRIRQTLLATNLAQGALIAWRLPEEKIEAAFEFLFQHDPFTGHVVIRTSEYPSGASSFRLWTTLKVPKPYSIVKHCEFLKETIGADRYRIMPPLRAFALGVGHMRRKNLEPGARASQLADAKEPAIVDLDEAQWKVLMALKREFEPEELRRDIWKARADEAGVDLETFYATAEQLNRLGVIGRFSTFLEHAKPVHGDERVAQVNGLFQWAVPPGREIEAGRELGRHLALTHCYWRDAGPDLDDVNIMAVAHGETKELVLAHKEAMDRHVREAGIPILSSNVFWGDRAEIKPSEISPVVYRAWCAEHGLDLNEMTESH